MYADTDDLLWRIAAGWGTYPNPHGDPVESLGRTYRQRRSWALVFDARSCPERAHPGSAAEVHRILLGKGGVA